MKLVLSYEYSDEYTTTEHLPFEWESKESAEQEIIRLLDEGERKEKELKAAGERAGNRYWDISKEAQDNKSINFCGYSLCRFYFTKDDFKVRTLDEWWETARKEDIGNTVNEY